MESISAPQSTIIGEEIPSLPEQLIIEEILPRLPAKSLLKFRCVAKSWCSLIGSKRFIKTHLKYSIKSSCFNNDWIFFDYVEDEFKKFCLPSFDKPFADPISHISDLGIHKSDRISPAGCCNGLVCILLNWKRFILWNPTTKKSKNLPDLYNLIQVKGGTIGLYGFGFDELSDDYKIFGIVNWLNARGCIAMVYSLRSNSWKHIEETDLSPFGDEYMGPDMGMLVGGKFHWCNYKRCIVSFDLNSHVSAVVELPSYIKGDLHSMGVIGGCLSAHFIHPNADLDVWVMKEYGVKESWDKVVTVPYYNHLEYSVPYDFEIPPPVAIAPNGKVLLIHHSTVIVYDPKCDVLPAFDDGFASAVCYLGVYIESLVSVAPDAK